MAYIILIEKMYYKIPQLRIVQSVQQQQNVIQIKVVKMNDCKGT